MSGKDKVRAALREIPSVDEIIDHLQNMLINAPYAYFIKIIRQILDDIRVEIRQGLLSNNIKQYTYSRIQTSLSNASIKLISLDLTLSKAAPYLNFYQSKLVINITIKLQTK